MKNNLAVIMCTWKRPERFQKTLDLLLEQNNNNFTVYIWNNNIEIKDYIDNVSYKYADKLKINITHSTENVGGFGRFLLAKTLINEHDKIIFIDDDQIFTNEMINIFLNHYDENSVKSRWAFRFNSNNYVDRHKVSISDKYVHYCGTGGMILPSKVFSCEELYNIPKEFLFVEDLWLCFIASHYLNMKLMSIVDNFLIQEADGKDQSTVSFITVKSKLLNYLINDRKWNILNK